MKKSFKTGGTVGATGTGGPPGPPGPAGPTGPAGPAPSGAANTVLATPDGAPGVSSLRSLVAADIPGLDAAKIISGLLALARGGTAVDLSGSGGATKLLAQDAAHVISARDLVAADIPNLDAAKITTGLLALARGGTGVDLSASGGATKILAQDAGQVISARDLVAADIPGLSAAKITSGLLALARGGTGVDLSASGGATAILAQDAAQVISARTLVAADIPNLDAGKITTGVLAAARGGSADLTAAGSGMFVGPGISTAAMATIATLGLVVFGGTANRVCAAGFYLPIRITIRKVSVRSGTSVQKAYIGIWSGDKTTKLVDAGVFDFSGGAGVTKSNTLGSPVTLNPGFYFYGCSSSGTTGTWAVIGAPGTTWNLLTNLNTVWVGQTGAGQVVSADILPSSISTLADGNFNFIIGVFES